MPAPFGNLHLVQTLPATADLQIVAPLSGTVQSISTAKSVLAASGLSGEGVVITLQGNRLIAPFNGSFSRQDQAGQHLVLHHQNGLRLDLHFDEACAAHHGKGFEWQTPAQSPMKAGQMLLQFDLALFARWITQPQCVIQLVQAPKFNRIWCRPCFHQAGDDPLFVIELQSKNHP